VVALAACGSKDHEPQIVMVTVPLPGELAQWMPPDVGSAWQGSWVSGLTFDIRRDSGTTALQIDGNRAVVFDGTRERTMTFAVIAPCLAEFVEIESEDTRGSVAMTKTISREIEFVRARGRLEVGRGWLGYVRGKAAIACSNSAADGAVYTLDERANCARWEQWPRTSPWQHTAARCTWSKRGGLDVLAIEHGQKHLELVADGEILRGDDTLAIGQTRASTFADAKAALPR